MRFMLEAAEPVIVKLIDNPWDIIIAITAIFSAVGSIVVSVIFGLSQRKHNKNSVRPITEITTGNYLHDIFVDFKNKGAGPLFIKEFSCSKDGVKADNLIDFMPEGITWATFIYSSLNGQTIAANDKFRLLELQIDTESTKELVLREDIKKILSKITIEVEYTDLFNTKFDKYIKTLDEFSKL